MAASLSACQRHAPLIAWLGPGQEMDRVRELSDNGAPRGIPNPRPTAQNAAAALKTVISRQFELANSICLLSSAATEQLLLSERADDWRVMAVRIVSQCAHPPRAGVPGIRASPSTLGLV